MNFAVLLLALASGAQADQASCAAAFKPEYSVEWGAERKTWDALCAKGYDQGDALREVQRQEMARCVARFSPYEAKQKIPSGEAAALCARGADGRAILAERTGDKASLTPVVPPKPREPARKPGDSKMGPFGRALDVAKTSWHPDACFAGLHYVSIESTFIPVDEWTRARAEGRPPNKDKTELEEYAYYFHSPSEAINAYRVSFGDKLEAAFCYKVDRMDGPDTTDTAPVTGLDGCLGPVEVDLPTAIDVATKNGWVMDHPLRAYLVQIPAGQFQRACKGRTRAYAPLNCDLLESLNAAKLRLVTGAPVWALTAGGKTAFVDALKGRFRYLFPGGMDLRAAKSFKFAESCMEDKKGPGQKFNQESQ